MWRVTSCYFVIVTICLPFDLQTFLAEGESESELKYGNCPTLTHQNSDSANSVLLNLISTTRESLFSVESYNVICQSSGTVKNSFRSAYVVAFYCFRLSMFSISCRTDAFAFVCNATNRWIFNPFGPGPFNISNRGIDLNSPTLYNCSFCSSEVPEVGVYDPFTACTCEFDLSHSVCL